MPYRIIKSADSFRGTFLFLAGFMFLTQALSYLFSSRALNSLRGLGWVADWVMVWHVGFVLTVACLFASVVGLLSRWFAKTSPRIMSYAFLAAMVPPVLMLVLSGWAVINGAGQFWLHQVPTYVVLAAMIYLGSEWPNPPRTPTWPTPSLPPTTAPPEVKN